MTWNDHPEAQALAQRRGAKPQRRDARARRRAAREEASSTTPTASTLLAARRFLARCARRELDSDGAARAPPLLDAEDAAAAAAAPSWRELDDRVTFRMGTHNGRAKAVEVQRISATSRDLTQRLSQPTYRLVPSDYGPAPAIRCENKQVSLGQRGSAANDWAHPPPDTAHDEAIAQSLGWRRVA